MQHSSEGPWCSGAEGEPSYSPPVSSPLAEPTAIEQDIPTQLPSLSYLEQPGDPAVAGEM